MSKDLSKPFILILVFLVSIGAYLVFRPFLKEIVMAIIIVSVFYPVYEKLVKGLKGRRSLAALLMCLGLVLIVITPSVRLMVYAGEKSVDAYNQATTFFENHDFGDVFKTPFFERGLLKYIDFSSLEAKGENVRDFSLSILKESSNWLLDGVTNVVKETANFLVSMALILVAMFFFFVDGKKMLDGIVKFSPLPDKYNDELFKRFRSISYSTFITTFIVALSQGLVGAVGFAIIGFPAVLAGLIVTILSLFPLGSSIFYIPIGIYYLLTGDIWQGLFIIAWGWLLISLIDNVLRTFLIKGDAEINPIFILFSILGGVSFFGFWGVILGPLVVSLAGTIYHIYCLEFCPEGKDNI